MESMYIKTFAQTVASLVLWELPSVTDLLENPPQKFAWMHRVRLAIKYYVKKMEAFTKEAETKPTLFSSTLTSTALVKPMRYGEMQDTTKTLLGKPFCRRSYRKFCKVPDPDSVNIKFLSHVPCVISLMRHYYTFFWWNIVF